MRVRYLLLALFVCFETANFTGFSWTRLRWVSSEELINAAIKYNYREIYAGLTEFKTDYASFNPVVYYWTDLTGGAGIQFWNKFFGLKLFQVRLPDAVVVVASDGMVRFSRPCGENKWCSPEIPPDRPASGIVGMVHGGEFSIGWADGSGTVLISGHCFAAFSSSQKPVLRIKRPVQRRDHHD